MCGMSVSIWPRSKSCDALLSVTPVSEEGATSMPSPTPQHLHLPAISLNDGSILAGVLRADNRRIAFLKRATNACCLPPKGHVHRVRFFPNINAVNASPLSVKTRPLLSEV